MGILARPQDDAFVITSDRSLDAARTARAPARLPEAYQVWTGSCWSSTKTEALGFASLDAADDYVRTNLTRMLT